MPDFDAWTWTRPLGFAALLLPPLLWVLVRVLDRPRPVYTGTVAIWRALVDRAAAGDARRLLPPLWLWLVSLSLGLGALALAGPERERAARPLRLEVVLDTSPSMFLPVREGASERRIDRALDEALRWLGEQRPAPECAWLRPRGDAVDRADGSAPPPEWLRAPTPPHPEPDLARYDRVGAFWVTDRFVEPRHAGIASSGGAAVPGPAAVGRVDGRGVLYVFDGEGLAPEPVPAPPASVRVEGALPELLDALVGIWAAERGLELRRGEAAEDELLVLRSVVGDRPSTARVARDGWSAAAEWSAPDTELPGDLAVWLATAEDAPRALVLHEPGRIVSHLLELTDIGGDPADFAVSWATLLDEALLEPPGVLAVAERQSAGEPRFVSPRPLAGEVEARPRPYAAWIAALAALCAFAGLAAAERAGRARRA